MFHHVALFRWVEGVTGEQVGAVEAALARLPSVVPELRDYRFGPDAGLRQGNWNFAVVATCDDADGWRTYTDHPEHQRVLVELIRPLLADRAAVQFDTSSTRERHPYC